MRIIYINISTPVFLATRVNLFYGIVNRGTLLQVVKLPPNVQPLKLRTPYFKRMTDLCKTFHIHIRVNKFKYNYSPRTHQLPYPRTFNPHSSWRKESFQSRNDSMCHAFNVGVRRSEQRDCVFSLLLFDLV